MNIAYYEIRKFAADHPSYHINYNPHCKKIDIFDYRKISFQDRVLEDRSPNRVNTHTLLLVTLRIPPTPNPAASMPLDHDQRAGKAPLQRMTSASLTANAAAAARPPSSLTRANRSLMRSSPTCGVDGGGEGRALGPTPSPPRRVPAVVARAGARVQTARLLAGIGWV
jgi:hypothetical protein